MSIKENAIGIIILIILLVLLLYRSGVSIHTDYSTGCQYLSSPHGGLVPRFDRTGKQICNQQEPGHGNSSSEDGQGTR